MALATSLFAHLKPFEPERYLAETARTLRPGGRLVGTWFLLNARIEAERAGLEVVSVLRGSWAGGGEKLGQDVVVAERRQG